MATLSTHVLDTSLGIPADGVGVTLSTGEGVVLEEGRTDTDGRIGHLGGNLAPGEYRLRFGTGDYLVRSGADAFYPEVVVTFTIAADEHHHIPLLLSPYGYSTYRGS